MNKKVTEYHVAAHYLAPELAKEINSLIAQGWQPLGTLIVAYKWNKCHEEYFVQPMVKYED